MIDGFFARVKKATEKYFPGIEIHVGYGSAVMNMKPTGRGEMAVPTTGAFKACQRIFGPQKVAVTDEFRSTAVSWETGLRKDAVYKKVESKETYFTDDGKERTRFVCTLGHTETTVGDYIVDPVDLYRRARGEAATDVLPDPEPVPQVGAAEAPQLPVVQLLHPKDGPAARTGPVHRVVRAPQGPRQAAGAGRHLEEDLRRARVGVHPVAVSEHDSQVAWLLRVTRTLTFAPPCPSSPVAHFFKSEEAERKGDRIG